LRFVVFVEWVHKKVAYSLRLCFAWKPSTWIVATAQHPLSAINQKQLVVQLPP
jgi:hypothetical protein